MHSLGVSTTPNLTSSSRQTFSILPDHVRPELLHHLHRRLPLPLQSTLILPLPPQASQYLIIHIIGLQWRHPRLLSIPVKPIPETANLSQVLGRSKPKAGGNGVLNVTTEDSRPLRQKPLGWLVEERCLSRDHVLEEPGFRHAGVVGVDEELLVANSKWCLHVNRLPRLD